MLYYFILLLGLALAQRTNSTNSTNTTSTNSTGLVHRLVNNATNATLGSSNTTSSNSTGPFNATLGTSNSSDAGQNSTSSGEQSSGEQSQSSSEQQSSNEQSSESSGQGQTQTTTTTTTTQQQGKGRGQQQQGQQQGQQQQGQQQQGQQQQGQQRGQQQRGQQQQGRQQGGKKGRFIICRTCGAACSSPQISSGVCNMKLKCVAKKAIPPNCGAQQIRPIPVMSAGQGQFLAGSPGQFTAGQGQFNSLDQGQLSSTAMGGQLNSFGQNGMLSMSSQLAATSRCAPLNCPMIPSCSWPSVLQTPMLGGCPGCPTCVIPGGCTADYQCSAGTYCVLGRCMSYAQEGESCGAASSLCQPPLVCTVMGTCYLPDCSCGFLPCPLSQQVTLEPDLSLVTGGCPPCPTCRK